MPQELIFAQPLDINAQIVYVLGNISLGMLLCSVTFHHTRTHTEVSYGALIVAG